MKRTFDGILCRERNEILGQRVYRVSGKTILKLNIRIHPGKNLKKNMAEPEERVLISAQGCREKIRVGEG